MKNNSFEAKGCLKSEDEIVINIKDSLYEKYSELLIKMNDVIKRNKKELLKQG